MQLKNAKANAGGTSNQEPKPALPAEVEAALDKVASLLAENNPKEALEYIGRTKSGSPWLRNAAGVCHMRLGHAKSALDTLKGLSLGACGFDLRLEAPMVFKTNYAVALLLSDNRDGFFRVLEDLHDESHPALDRLRKAVLDWKKSLSFFGKLRWRLGGNAAPLTLPFAPGDLM